MGQVAHLDLAILGRRPRTLSTLPQGDEEGRSLDQAPRRLLQQHELQKLLKNLGIGLYPTRPRSPPPALGQDLAEESLFSDCESQVPAGWDEWEAA